MQQEQQQSDTSIGRICSGSTSCCRVCRRRRKEVGPWEGQGAWDSDQSRNWRPPQSTLMPCSSPTCAIQRPPQTPTVSTAGANSDPMTLLQRQASNLR